MTQSSKSIFKITLVLGQRKRINLIRYFCIIYSKTFIKAIRVMDLYSLSDTICLSLDFLSDNATFLKIFDNLTDHKIFE